MQQIHKIISYMFRHSMGDFIKEYSQRLVFSKQFVVRNTVTHLHLELKFQLKHRRKYPENVKMFIVHYCL
jgi:hypothetical protein